SVGLPDFDERVRHGCAALVKHTPSHDDTLADRLALGPRVAREISILRRHRADSWPRPRQLGRGERGLDKRQPWRAFDGRAVSVVQIRWEDLAVPADDGPNRRHYPALPPLLVRLYLILSRSVGETAPPWPTQRQYLPPGRRHRPPRAAALQRSPAARRR